MKRNKRTHQEITKKETTSSFSNITSPLASTHKAPGSNIYGSLDSVFDILVPLQSKDVHRHKIHDICSGDASQSDYDSDIDKKSLRSKFQLCQSCGRQTENCECTGCGDFEEFSSFLENEDCKTLECGSESNGFKYEIIDIYSEKQNNKSHVLHNVTSSNSNILLSGDNVKETKEVSSLITDGLETSKQILTSVGSDTEFIDQEGAQNKIMDDSAPEDDETLSDVPPIQSSEEEGQEGETLMDFLGAGFLSGVEERIDQGPGTAPSNKQPGEVSGQHPPAEAVDSIGDSLMNQRLQKPAEPVSSAEGISEGPQGVLDEDMKEQKTWGLADISRIPITDSAVLAELKIADEQAKNTSVLITKMKESIAQYQNRELSEEDTLVLKLKKLELVKKLGEFEEITQKVQQLIGLPNMKNVPLSKSLEDQLKCLPSSPSSMMLFDGRSDASSASSALEVIPEEDEECRCKEEDIARFKKMEDTIPKVIVCGAESRVPRIIVCETPKTSPPQPNVCRCPSPPEDVCGCPPPPEDVCGCPPPPEDVCRCPPPPEDVCRCPPPPEDDCRCPLPPGDDSQDYLLQSLTCRLSESYTMQEKLASDNAQLEKGRYYLQEELLQKDTAVEVLQRRVGSLQREMRIISKENTVLSEKLSEINQMDCWCGKKPSRVNNKPQTAPCGCGNPKLQQYSNTTSHLERQLRQIEGEVKSMQCELVQVQRERQQLEQQRKLLKCSQPPAAAPAGPPCPPCCPRNQSRDGGPEQALRELKEQYSRLQDDYKCKVAEVAALKRENDELKCANDRCNEVTDEYENQIRNLQTQLRAVEQELKKFKGSKDQVSSHEQQLQIAKQRLRDAQDELEELRGLVTEQSSQLEEYRNKYLQAQQMVEEQRRQIDKMEVDNNRITDQVNLEIQRVKSQFQEKLQELTPLPDILKATQMKLQEAQQMRLLAERNCEDMAQEAKLLKEKVAQLLKELENNQNSHQLGSDEREAMLAKLEMWEKKYSEAHEDLCRARAELARVEEMACQAQRRLDEKIHEVAQLSTQLETVREESARQVARIKDRMETVRRSLQCQISELERQLAQSRAAAKSAQKDRDEIRQRMQCQINNLNENFDQAQMRIRSLQSHVNFLKTSYTNIFEGGNMMIQDGPAYGLDSRCDCNF